MTNASKDRLISNLFLGVTILGTLFVLTEIILQSMGASLCGTTGCKVVASSARFGEISVLLMGVAIFSVLLSLVVLGRYFNKPSAEKMIEPVLVVALACEGFFTGYQAFRLYTTCIFCLVVFGFLVTLGVLRLLLGKKELITGFAASAGVFLLFYLVLPVQSSVRLPDSSELILFYSTDCKYCSEVMKEFEEKGVKADHALVSDYSGFLKSMGIEHVPTLYINAGREKRFITGKEEIKSFLQARLTDNNTVRENPGQSGALSRKKSGTVEQKKSTVPQDFFGSRDNALQLILPGSEEGICKQDIECK